MSGGREPPRLEGFTQRDEESALDVFESIRSGQAVRSVKPFRFLTAYEGACVVCEFLMSPRRVQAVRICSIDDSTAIRPSQLPQRTRVVVVPESGWETLDNSSFRAVAAPEIASAALAAFHTCLEGSSPPNRTNSSSPPISRRTPS